MKKINIRYLIYIIIILPFVLFPIYIYSKQDAKKEGPKEEIKNIDIEEINFNEQEIILETGEEYSIETTIFPIDNTDTITWSSSDNNIATVENGNIKALTTGEVTITAKTSTDLSATCTVKIYPTDTDYVKTYFLNTQNRPNMKKKYTSNQAIILTTRDSKYLLFDTGDKNDKEFETIFGRLKNLQGNDHVVIDYIIISHLDDDHYGNTVNLIKDTRIDVKNVIIKYEEISSMSNKEKLQAYKDIVKQIAEENATLYTSDNITKEELKKLTGVEPKIEYLSEEYKIPVGRYLNIYLYNVNDVYANYDPAKCVEGNIIKFTNRANHPNLYKTSDGKYVYFDNTDGSYPNVELKTIDQAVSMGTKFNRYYYAYRAGKRENCRSNTNSIASLVEVNTKNESKYIYIPGDLENNGYSILPTKEEGYENKIGGNGATILYKSLSYDQKNKSFIKEYNTIKIPSETNVALAIANKLQEKKNNIVIYQETHHGINNAEDAINILGLNRSTIYTIATSALPGDESPEFLTNRAYYYTLSKVPESHKLHSGNGKNGIYCNINNQGITTCKDI